MLVKVGQPAARFSLPDENKNIWRLEDWHGKMQVMLVFYSADFSPICPVELDLLTDLGADFLSRGIVVAAISCDNTYSHAEFKRQRGYAIPLLSDFWPHGEVSRAYGVFAEDRGMSKRGTFLIDLHGNVAWAAVKEIGETRTSEDFQALLAKAA